jgi:hypothetical protein
LKIGRNKKKKKKKDTETIRILTMYKMQHPKADTGKLFVRRKEGGTGLVQTEVTYKAETIDIAEYRNTKYKEAQIVNIVKTHESTLPNMNSTIKTAATVAGQLNQSN